MKVLFLDIDGVCNAIGSTTERFMGFIGIDTELASRVQSIVAQTGCKIVLSSTWRLDEPFRDEVRRVVGDFIDVTPRFDGAMRGDEIEHWLKEHPEVERYAILDDDSDFHEDQPLFRTLTRDGITIATMEKVIEHLNK